MSLHAERTEVNLGEPVRLTLAATNSIAKPRMMLKFVLKMPSGWSLLSGFDTKACVGGLCSADYEIYTGRQRNISVEMLPNQAGTVFVEARMEWDFKGDEAALEQREEKLELHVVAPPTPVVEATPTPESNGGICNFPSGSAGVLDLTGVTFVAGLAFLAVRRRMWGRRRD